MQVLCCDEAGLIQQLLRRFYSMKV